MVRGSLLYWWWPSPCLVIIVAIIMVESRVMVSMASGSWSYSWSYPFLLDSYLCGVCWSQMQPCLSGSVGVYHPVLHLIPEFISTMCVSSVVSMKGLLAVPHKREEWSWCHDSLSELKGLLALYCKREEWSSMV